MTTTTTRAPVRAAEPAGAPSSADIAALIADAPVPRPTLLKTFNAMMAREFRVLRRNAIATFMRFPAPDARTLVLAIEIAHALEGATDHLAHAALSLRDRVLEELSG